MPRLEARLDILPPAQREIWEALRPAPKGGLVLYGATAVALHRGHRASVDFDFFGADPLDKDAIRRAFAFVASAEVLQDMPDILVVSAAMPSGPVRVSFFGGLSIGHLNEPLLTADGVLRVASRPAFLARGEGPS
ncbi:MAG TPA: nucleotidyl transferase AbiEii/AbiGii toxin family protein [Hyphomicrobiales bacterium]|nr:nucleotidyl transferase AbiEii/AbiGii toxin family protein [Hyphomicrobiales bacterium]